MKSFLISFLLLLCSCGQMSKKGGSGTHQGKASSLSEVELKIDVKKITLDNGLRVLVVENHKLPIYSYYTFFDIGARHESAKEGTTGATHFLEHMMFKGAGKYGPKVFDAYVESNGGRTNAYTSFDETVYHQHLPSHTLEKIIDMEADRLQHLLLEEVAFEKERKVILEERKLRYENSPRTKLFYGIMQNVYKGTPYGGSVIGAKEDVENLSRERMRQFFKDFYTPNNAVIVIVGDVDAEKTFAMIRDKFGKIKASDKLDKLKATHDDPKRYAFKTKFKRDVRLHGNAPTPLVMIGYKGTKLGAEEGFVHDILTSVLGSGVSSHLNQRFVKNRRPMLSRVSMGTYQLKNNGLVYVGAELLPKVGLKTFKRAFFKETRKMCEKGITERAVQKTKNQFMLGFYDAIKTNKGMAHFLGVRETTFNDYAYYNKELKVYSAITVDQVKKACRKLFKKNDYIFVSIWNKNKKSRKGKR